MDFLHPSTPLHRSTRPRLAPPVARDRVRALLAPPTLPAPLGRAGRPLVHALRSPLRARPRLAWLAAAAASGAAATAWLGPPFAVLLLAAAMLAAFVRCVFEAVHERFANALLWIAGSLLCSTVLRLLA